MAEPEDDHLRACEIYEEVRQTLEEVATELAAALRAALAPGRSKCGGEDGSATQRVAGELFGTLAASRLMLAQASRVNYARPAHGGGHGLS